MQPACGALAGSQNKGALLRVVHVPDSLLDSAVSNWSIPHETVLGVTDGDWWDAAQIYREWALGNAAWAASGTLQARAQHSSSVQTYGC
jgi:hypothetical protein